MPDLSALGWIAVAVAALFVGFAKTSIGALGSVSVALFAAVLPAKESTGALLPLLLVGDLTAIVIYRAHVSWRTLARLFPAVIVGILTGVLFVGLVDDTVMRRTIGVVLLGLVGLQLWLRHRSRQARSAAAVAPAAVEPVASSGALVTASYGSLAGFTTMVANAGGAVMALYLLSMRLDMMRFLGTTAWFFFLVNLTKLPFSVALGLVHTDALRMDAMLAILVLAGAWVGRIVITRIEQRRFELLVLVFTVLSSVPLLR